MIFCVEDDVSIRDLMIYALETSGHKALGFNDGAELFDALSQGDNVPELIMLDIMLPGEDGLEILKRLKANANTKNIPVIMATAKGTESAVPPSSRRMLSTSTILEMPGSDADACTLGRSSGRWSTLR